MGGWVSRIGKSVFLCSLFASHPTWAEVRYSFDQIQQMFSMKDGVKLSVTLYMPRAPEEKLPVLLEMHPYRKDDLFYLRDFEIYSYFARNGYIVARVDVRGTGGSEGKIPDREYSDQELDDAVEVIRQLSLLPSSNGSVGMMGISWSGFNSLQVAMRRPPALKAICAVDASDDIYHDDVHFIDGIFHVDEYELSVENDLSLPQSPKYEFNEDYFENRFSVKPWFFIYKEKQRDGEFWQSRSLKNDYSAIQIPVYLIGGLLDGYRDSVVRMLEKVKVPMKAEIGPWNHAWPTDGVPGPNYEWKGKLLKWWNHWLKRKDFEYMKSPRVSIFVRKAQKPDAKLKTAAGEWRLEDWPIARTQWKNYFPNSNRDLDAQFSPGSTDVHELMSAPSSGTTSGFWWGEATGDMAKDDGNFLVYNSEALKESAEIIGMPEVSLLVSSSTSLAHWMVKLEDVFPTGEVAFVTGAAINGSQRASTMEPMALIPNEKTLLQFKLHLTTWTFEPGHRIRVTVSNSLFPMFWPLPAKLNTKLYLGADTVVRLPIISFENRPKPKLEPPEEEEQAPDGFYEDGFAWPYLYQVVSDVFNLTTWVDWKGAEGLFVKGNRYRFDEWTHHQTSDLNPADSSFKGEAWHQVMFPSGRQIQVGTQIKVQSDEKSFHVEFRRRATENEQLIKEKVWTESIPRDFQ